MKAKPRTGGRTGQVLIVGCVLFLVLALIAALTVDTGWIALTHTRLQNTADAASLAAIQALVSQRGGGADEVSARQAALAEATAIQQANDDSAGIDVVFGTVDVDGVFVPAGTETAGMAARATVFRSGDAPAGELSLFFAPLLGKDSCEVAGAATALASSNISGVNTNLSPFSIPLAAIGDPGEVMTIYPINAHWDPTVEDDMVAPGCWGLLNLDGGNLGTTELIDWILNGYDGGMTIDPDLGYLWVDGTTGFRAAMEDAVVQMVGTTMIGAVYDQVVGQGSSGEFRVVGFVAATILECDLTGNDPRIVVRMEEVGDYHDVVVARGTGWSGSNMRKIMLIE